MVEGAEVVKTAEVVEVLEAVVTLLVVDGTALELEGDVEEATEVALVPSNAVANTTVALTPAVVGMIVASAVES